MAERIFAYVVSIIVIGVVAWPMFRNPQVDSFPHSNYPMFSRKKKRTVRFQQAVGRRVDKSKFVLPPKFLGTEEVLQASATLRRAVYRGKKTTQTLCGDIAEVVAQDADTADIVRVEIATVSYDAVSYFSGNIEPKRYRVRGSCEVKR